MPEGEPKIAGIERAAILLLSLGEQQAAAVLRHMAPKEVQKLGVAMSGLTNVSKERVGAVLANFVQSVQGQTSIGVGSEEYIRKMLVGAFGEQKALSVIDRIDEGNNPKGLDTLKWMEAEAVVGHIRQEHPQIIAIVLAHLDSEQSAEILSKLPDDIRADVLMRVATMDVIPSSALDELNEVLEKQFSGMANIKSAKVGGAKTAADILNLVDGDMENELINKVKESDEELAEQIEDLMLVFEDLAAVPDRGMQALLREVSGDNLILALKGSSDVIKDKVFKNMSQRAAEMMRDDLDAKGPVRLSEVETAQKEILATARRMSEAGDLALGGKGGEEYV